MNLFQSPEWEQFKLATGYQKSYRVDDILVLQKQLPFGRSMLYSPMITLPQSSPLRQGYEGQANLKPQTFISKIKNLEKENETIFYRAEFDIPESYKLEAESLGFIKAFEEMQPEHTLVLNISKSEQDILGGMKQKGRYNIKIAEKHGVKVKKSRNIDDFYALYEQTAKRQKITYRSKRYFQALLDNLEPKGYCELFVAYLPQADNSQSSDVSSQKQNYQKLSTNNQPPTTNVLAAAIITFYKDRATYLFGASSNEMRNIMAPYMLHWKIIEEAKRRGIVEYDLFGIAPNDDPNHPWAGITRFKKQFGGNEVDLMGSWDMILRPTEYKIFKLAEKIRRH